MTETTGVTHPVTDTETVPDGAGVEGPDDKNCLPEYEELPRAFWPLMVLCALGYPLMLAALYFWPGADLLDRHSTHHPAEVLIFLANLYFFACFWVIYFASAKGRQTRRQTLRTLLISHSRQWEHDEDTTQVENYREKAGSTMATQAIFIAIAVFIISGLIDSGLITRETAGRTGGELDGFVAALALLSAVAAFTILLIATDAAETMFNRFKVREWQAVSFLYRTSAGLKYYGFVLTFLSIGLFVFNINAVASSLAILIFMCLGYRYWFTDISDAGKYRYEVWMFSGCLGLFNILTVILVYLA